MNPDKMYHIKSKASKLDKFLFNSDLPHVVLDEMNDKVHDGRMVYSINEDESMEKTSEVVFAKLRMMKFVDKVTKNMDTEETITELNRLLKGWVR